MTSETSSKTNSKQPNILILGGGYIGTYIKNNLRLSNVTLVNSKKLDYYSKLPLWKYLMNNNITHVINCSGYTGNPNIESAEQEKELCWELNVNAPLRVANVCAPLGVKYVHIGTGCIYNGYKKEYSEEDPPNYGLWSNESPFYSKTKHAFEVMSTDLDVAILRIRQPVCGILNPKSLYSKFLKYNSIANASNSKTYLKDLVYFIESLIESERVTWTGQNIFNVVNPNPLSNHEICEYLKSKGHSNPNWCYWLTNNTNRSSCILTNKKAMSIYPLRSELAILNDIL